MTRDRAYGYGVIMFILGAAGMAENITSGRGSFLISAIFFSVGLSCILNWWIGKWNG